MPWWRRGSLFFNSPKKTETFMPLKLHVGISKKLGLPRYSSLGASCNVEVELDHSLLFENLEGFH